MMGRIVLLIAVMATAILSVGLTFFAAESTAAAETTHATNFANAGLASRNIGPTPASRARTVGTPSQSDPVLVGVGDIASCSSSGDEATAALLEGIPGTVFTTGDNAYESGTASEFSDCYGPSGDATRRAPCPLWATTSTRRLAPRVTSATSAPPRATR
jgi:hypothetical protein